MVYFIRRFVLVFAISQEDETEESGRSVKVAE